MTMNYEELDAKTRDYMLDEFEKEQASVAPYRSKALSSEGITAYPDLMRDAIRSGTESSLCQALAATSYWIPQELYTRNGMTRTRPRNIVQSAERLSLTEFSTWYVRGLAMRLLVESVQKCQVYRGALPKWELGDCAKHEGLVVSVQEIYDNHRVRYWPEPGNIAAFSIPFGPGCHHVIRRFN